MKVLSTIKSKLYFLVISATAEISVTFIMGLVGVSIYTALVSGVIKSSIFSLQQLILENLMLFFSETFRKRRILPPYKSESAII
jgi:hypothetical protein